MIILNSINKIFIIKKKNTLNKIEQISFLMCIYRFQPPKFH